MGDHADIDHAGLTGVGVPTATFNDHSARHENGGADEISIAGLDGTPTELTNHLNDAADAHDASAVSFDATGLGNTSATEVQTALEDFDAAITAAGGGGGDFAFEAELVAGVGGLASLDFTGIPGTGRHLEIYAMVRGEKAAGFDDLHARVNGDTGGNYDLQLQSSFNTTTAASQGLAGTSWGVLAQPAAASATAGLFTMVRIVIPYYANTLYRKSGRFEISDITAEGSGGIVVRQGHIHWRSASAITQVTLYFAGGDVAEGSRASLYLVG